MHLKERENVKTHIRNIKPEHITPNRLQHKIDLGFLHEGYIHNLDMREIRHQLHPDPQKAFKRDILNKNRQRSCRQSFSNPDMKGDLWIDLVPYLLFRHFGRIIGSEANAPIHHDDIIVRLGVCPNFIYPRSLIPKRQIRQPQGIKKSRRILAQDLIDSRLYRRRQDGLVDSPKTIEKVVEPFR